MTERFGEFVTLLLVINPLEAVPGYLTMTQKVKRAAQQKIALYAVVIAFAVLVFFIFGGSFVLSNMHIPLRAFQIAGGIVLFLVAIEMVRGTEEVPAGRVTPDKHMSLAIYPLAVPKIAGPGAMLAVILLTDDDRANVAGQLGTVAVLAVVMVIQLGALLAALPIVRVIGPSAVNVTGRIMGILLAALAVSFVLTAVADWLRLPTL